MSSSFGTLFTVTTFGESHGIGVGAVVDGCPSKIALNETDGVTTVKLTMSRRYSWDSAEPNPQRSMRESQEFRERTRAMWQDRFLARLRSLVEQR